MIFIPNYDNMNYQVEFTALDFNRLLITKMEFTVFLSFIFPPIWGDFLIDIPGIVEVGLYRRDGIPKDGIRDIGCWDICF